MGVLERIASLSSPYPLVQLEAPTPPKNGLQYPAPKICAKVFSRGDCERFYRSLDPAGPRQQCPYGFSVWPLQLGDNRVAITGLIAAPRFGSDRERLRAKEYPHNRVWSDAVTTWIRNVEEILKDGDVEREEEFSRRLDALHEIRRFNQIIKTNMERACEKESSTGDPDDAPVQLVRAYRASSLISLQLDALDLLANPASAMSFSPRPWVFYRTVDKLVRIYRVIADSRDVRIRLSGTSLSHAAVDQRTIHIIPSVFIDNAVKYSKAGETVEVHVSEGYYETLPVITLCVKSTGPVATPAEERVLFVERARGKAATAIAEGSGVGLTLAKVVAKQHNGWIGAQQRPLTNNRSEWTFTFQIRRLN